MQRQQGAKQRASLGLHLDNTRNNQLVRYLDVSRKALGSLQHLFVLTDARRLGGKEVALFAVAGVDLDRVAHFAWAPPQASPSVVPRNMTV